MKVIAHRGASGLAKNENTTEAFDIAIKIGANMVEFDVRCTKDHQLIIFHNKDIEGKELKDLTYQEINEIAKEHGYQVPLYEDVLKQCKGKIQLDIELKEGGFEEEVIKKVLKYYKYDEFFIKSFRDDVVLRIKELDANITAGLLVGREHGVTLAIRYSEYFPEERLRQCKADFISPNYLFATKPFLRRMKQMHMPVYIWTVNEKKQMRKYMDRNVDGIITDRPDILMECMSH